jgi:phosphohistidine phosphatase
MKRLILMRHAKAEQGNFETFDFNRKLADKGKIDANSAAKVLKTHLQKIDLIVTSSSKRTAKTAKIVAENFDIDKKEIVFVDELYEAETNAYIHVIRNLSDLDANTVLLVGHNPTIGAMAAIMSDFKIQEFKPGSFAVFQIPLDTWKLFKIEESKLELSHKP